MAGGGGINAQVLQIEMETRQAVLDAQRQAEDAERMQQDSNLAAIGARALAEARLQDIKIAEIERARDAENKAKITAQSGGTAEEKESPVDQLGSLFTPPNVQNPEAGVPGMSGIDVLGMPRGSAGGGPQMVQESKTTARPGGSQGSVGGFNVPERTQTFEDQTQTNIPANAITGVSQQRSRRTIDSPNALTPFQALQIRMDAAKQQVEQRTERLKIWADTDQPTFDMIHRSVAASNPTLADELLFYRESKERARRMEGTVTVFDPASPTGGRTIPRSDLVDTPGGMPAVPKNTDAMSVNVDMGKLTPSVKSEIQKSLYDDANRMDRLNAILDSYQPQFLQTIPITQFEAAERAERLGLSATQADALVQLQPGMRAKFRQFQLQNLQNLNQYVREITGATMTIQERSRLEESIPNMSDSPSTFIAKWNASRDMIRMSIARKQMILKEGFGDTMIRDLVGESKSTDEVYGQITFGVVQEAMSNRAEFNLDAVRKEHPDWSVPRAEDEAMRLTDIEFGLRAAQE